MKKVTTILLMLAGIFVFASSTLAQARQGDLRERGFRKPRAGRMLMVLKAKQEELNITDEQLDKIKAMQLKQEEIKVAHQNKMNKLRLEMKKLMLEENRDYEKIQGLLSQMSDSRNEMFINRLKSREEILNILTPEQKEALKAAAKDRPGRGRGFLRNRQGRRFPPQRGGIQK